MNNKKKVSIAYVAIHWVAAIVWIINLLADLTHGYVNTESFRVHIFCTIVWSIAAIIWTVRYLEYKRYNK